MSTTFGPATNGISVMAMISSAVKPGATASITNCFPSQRITARSVTT